MKRDGSAVMCSLLCLCLPSRFGFGFGCGLALGAVASLTRRLTLTLARLFSQALHLKLTLQASRLSPLARVLVLCSAHPLLVALDRTLRAACLLIFRK